MIVMNGKSGIRKMYEKAVCALHYISKTWMENFFKDDTRRLRFVSFWL